jgi:hypothetical protein
MLGRRSGLLSSEGAGITAPKFVPFDLACRCRMRSLVFKASDVAVAQHARPMKAADAITISLAQSFSRRISSSFEKSKPSPASCSMLIQKPHEAWVEATHTCNIPQVSANLNCDQALSRHHRNQ